MNMSFNYSINTRAYCALYNITYVYAYDTCSTVYLIEKLDYNTNNVSFFSIHNSMRKTDITDVIATLTQNLDIILQRRFP